MIAHHLASCFISLIAYVKTGFFLSYRMHQFQLTNNIIIVNIIINITVIGTAVGGILFF